MNEDGFYILSKPYKLNKKEMGQDMKEEPISFLFSLPFTSFPDVN